jgi:2Fe-2S ferredoxin
MMQFDVNERSRKVAFEPLGKVSDAHADDTILDAARRAAVPLGSSCGAIGICARCRVTVLSGHGNLTPPTAIELRIGRDRGFAADERMACQAAVLGEVVVTTGYW